MKPSADQQSVQSAAPGGGTMATCKKALANNLAHMNGQSDIAVSGLGMNGEAGEGLLELARKERMSTWRSARAGVYHKVFSLDSLCLRAQELIKKSQITISLAAFILLLWFYGLPYWRARLFIRTRRVQGVADYVLKYGMKMHPFPGYEIGADFKPQLLWSGSTSMSSTSPPTSTRKSQTHTQPST